MDNRPNILFLMTDQQRYDHLGCVNPVVKTPCLDALAAESVFFTQAFTSNPACVPARAAIYTGRYPSQCAVPSNCACLPATQTTFMALLRDAGYYTAVIGKQHFNGSAIDRGYVYEDIIDSHNPPAVISDAPANGRHDNSYVRFLYENGFRAGAELYEPVDDVVNRWKVEPRFYVDSFVGAQALAWLRETRPAADPWFCCVSFPGPHGPVDGYGLPQEDLYPLEAIDLPETDLETLRAKPEHYQRFGNGGRAVDKPFTEEHIRRAWYANVSIIDEQVGAILTALKERGDYDNTIVFFTTDHGDFSCDLNRVDKGQCLLDVLTHIPFLVKPPVPGFPGKRESSLISSVDIAATCLAAAGISPPRDMASRDLSPYWATAADLDDREAVYMEAAGIRGLRTHEWKYCYYRGRTDGELYDLKADPLETRNLWDEPGQQARKTAFQQHLVDQLIALGGGTGVPWSGPQYVGI